MLLDKEKKEYQRGGDGGGGDGGGGGELGNMCVYIYSISMC
jgi:hypothetical protein